MFHAEQERDALKARVAELEQRLPFVPHLVTVETDLI